MVDVEKLFEKMYVGNCNVIVRKKQKNPNTSVTEFVEETVLKNIPCRLSYNSAPTTGKDIVSSVTQEIELFLSPKYSIPEGSKIVVTQRGCTNEFSHSGKSKIYPQHQEIILDLFKEWA